MCSIALSFSSQTVTSGLGRDAGSHSLKVVADAAEDFLISELGPGAGCHGQRPSISTTRDQLKKVRIKMIAPSIPMFISEGAKITVRITSAATRNSNPSDSALPKKTLYL
jgi:hypothetical protein